MNYLTKISVNTFVKSQYEKQQLIKTTDYNIIWTDKSSVMEYEGNFIEHFRISVDILVNKFSNCGKLG